MENFNEKYICGNPDVDEILIENPESWTTIKKGNLNSRHGLIEIYAIQAKHILSNDLSKAEFLYDECNSDFNLHHKRCLTGNIPYYEKCGVFDRIKMEKEKAYAMLALGYRPWIEESVKEYDKNYKL